MTDRASIRIPGRLIGIDHGSKRIGLALSDAMGIVARELTILRCSTPERDLQQILQIAQRERACGFVVGVPHNPNAPKGLRLQAEIVKCWIERLRGCTDQPVFEVSEYLTSEEARLLARRKKRKAQAPIDDLAARVILQSFLDAQSYSS